MVSVFIRNFLFISYQHPTLLDLDLFGSFNFFGYFYYYFFVRSRFSIIFKRFFRVILYFFQFGFKLKLKFLWKRCNINNLNNIIPYNLIPSLMKNQKVTVSPFKRLFGLTLQLTERKNVYSFCSTSSFCSSSKFQP